MENAPMEIAKPVLEYVRVLIWPAVVVTICLVFRGQLVALLNRIRHAELPGGVAVDLDQEIKEVKALSAKVQEEPTPPDKKRKPAIPLTEANARLIQLGLRPSPSGLDVNSTTVRGVCAAVVTDRRTGERYIHRDPDPWTALVRAAEAAAFEPGDG